MQRLRTDAFVLICGSFGVLAAAHGPQAVRTEPPPQPAAPQLTLFEPKVGQEGKDVVWVPTPDALVEKMLDLAEVGPRDYVIDLGSGDGRTVVAAATASSSSRTWWRCLGGVRWRRAWRA